MAQGVLLVLYVMRQTPVVMFELITIINIYRTIVNKYYYNIYRTIVNKYHYNIYRTIVNKYFNILYFI